MLKITPNPNTVKHTPAAHGGIFSIKNPNEKIVDFSSNVNPLGCHPGVKKYLKNQLNQIHVYPDSESTRLRSNLKWFTGINTSQILIGNGATEIIYNFCSTFVNKKSKVLIPCPTFSEYEKAVNFFGGKAMPFRTLNLNLDLQKFLKKIPTKGIVFICNPNNPTGEILSKKNMEQIVKLAEKKSTLVFVDETFIELVPDSNPSLVKNLKSYENLFILRSFTKSFGLAGLRIGYGLGSKKIIEILQRVKIPWNVNYIAQTAASAALCYSDFLEKSRKNIKKENLFLMNSLSKIEWLSCFSSSTNFILIKSKINSKLLQKQLLKKNILVRDCSTFCGLDENYIRIAVKNRAQNKLIVKALGDIKW
ncbi:histidinol-phosphate transaminase [Candidatus Nitrosopelagicus sp.]|nr:histidinol-phosphate transaminase [Candidatus Nitrosopelagicus sp.]